MSGGRNPKESCLHLLDPVPTFAPLAWNLRGLKLTGAVEMSQPRIHRGVRALAQLLMHFLNREVLTRLTLEDLENGGLQAVFPSPCGWGLHPEDGLKIGKLSVTDEDGVLPGLAHVRHSEGQALAGTTHPELVRFGIL